AALHEVSKSQAARPRGCAQAGERRVNIYSRTLSSRTGERGEKQNENNIGRKKWWAREDSNLQPSGYEPLALTIELRPPPNGRATAAPRQQGVRPLRQSRRRRHAQWTARIRKICGQTHPGVSHCTAPAPAVRKTFGGFTISPNSVIAC